MAEIATTFIFRSEKSTWPIHSGRSSWPAVDLGYEFLVTAEDDDEQQVAYQRHVDERQDASDDLAFAQARDVTQPVEELACKSDQQKHDGAKQPR